VSLTVDGGLHLFPTNFASLAVTLAEKVQNNGDSYFQSLSQSPESRPTARKDRLTLRSLLSFHARSAADEFRIRSDQVSDQFQILFFSTKIDDKWLIPAIATSTTYSTEADPSGPTSKELELF